MDRKWLPTGINSLFGRKKKSNHMISHSSQHQTVALTRSAIYKLLAKSFCYPTREALKYFQSPKYLETLSLCSSLDTCTSELKEGAEALHQLIVSWPEREVQEKLEYEYNRLFAHLGSAQCPPYETEYGFDNVFQKTAAMADIAGFYSAYGLEVSDTNTERVDFISTELEFMSYLTVHEAYAREHDNNEQLEICLDTQRKFIRDHLGRWMTIFVELLRNSTDNAFYLGLGKLTEEFLNFEARILTVELDKVSAPSKMTNEPQTPFSCNECLPMEQKAKFDV